MYQNENTTKIRRTIFIVFLAILVLIGWIVFTSIRDQGTIKVSLIRTPFDSTVMLGDTEIKGSNIQLKPGTYVFNVSREGFYTKDIVATIDTNGRNSITFPLSPESEEAKKLIAEDEKYQYNHTLSGGIVIDPVLDILPVRNVIYTIDSEARQEAYPSTPINLTITASKGYRNTAIQALIDKGVTPSNYTYTFLNYKDPF